MIFSKSWSRILCKYLIFIRINIWHETGFLRQVGCTLGAGFRTKVLGTKQNHDLALTSANLGWVFADVIATDKWYRGNLELLVELFGGGSLTLMTAILSV